MAGYIGSKAVLLSTTAAEVSGDADIGGSVLVDTIKADNGTTAMTINSSGDVIQTNYMIDMWRLTANFDTNDATITGWERPDDASSGRIGTGMTESSGVFTFPSTGVYLVTTHFRIAKLGAGDATLGYTIKVSTDSGGSSDTVATGYEGDQSSSTVNQNASIQALVNVTNASNFQVFFKTTSMANSSRINGNSNESQSIVTFERKGPSQ